eukprot:TRINITY_DN3777_c0_g1_i1.p1 TRINITY_DN3777_c0_g1~~TRINITY_DN3777_c0_g1_i1.p1  ORF type:complete len:183 (-),score=23.35 TRINITY_DN3777_c0_g1_i1:79-603(-)
MVANWKYHEFEAWATAFNDWNINSIYSGGDDCKFCIWDLRCPLIRPMSMFRADQGVCLIQQSPFDENLVAVGSYDEKLRIFDVRKPRQPVSEFQGCGGLWRTKWHPTRRNTIATASMHGGFSVYDISKDDGDIKSVALEDPNHLGYGADWHYSCDQLAGAVFYGKYFELFSVEV